MNHFVKNHCLVALALAMLLVISAPVLADEARGAIAMIDPDNHTFTLVDDNNNVQNYRFLIGGQVFLNDEEVTIWDLQGGDQVAVTFERTDGENQVTAIECRRLE